MLTAGRLYWFWLVEWGRHWLLELNWYWILQWDLYIILEGAIDTDYWNGKLIPITGVRDTYGILESGIFYSLLECGFDSFSCIGIGTGFWNWGFIRSPGTLDCYWLQECGNHTHYWIVGLVLATGMGDWQRLLNYVSDSAYWNGDWNWQVEWWINSDYWNGGWLMSFRMEDWKWLL